MSLPSIDEVARRLLPFARSHGIEIQKVKSIQAMKIKNPGLCAVVREAPFSSSVALQYAPSVLYYSSGLEGEQVGALIHELGHLVHDTADTIFDSNELDWVGWEYALARRTRLVKTWMLSMKNYALGPELDFGDLMLEDQREFLRDSLQKARQKGFL